MVEVRNSLLRAAGLTIVTYTKDKTKLPRAEIERRGWIDSLWIITKMETKENSVGACSKKC